MRKLLSIFCLYGISFATAHAQALKAKNNDKFLDSVASTYSMVTVEVIPAANHRAVTYQNIPYTLIIRARSSKDNDIASSFVQLACLYYDNPDKGIWAYLIHKSDEAFNTDIKSVNNANCEYFIGRIIATRKLTDTELAATKEMIKQNGN